MFQKETIVKKNFKKIIVGYDLGKTFSQISYCSLDGEGPETVSAVAGTEQYNIPTVLCKRSGVSQWYYGKEAVKHAREEGGILVEDLVTLAERGEEVLVEDSTFDPVALLTLFVKRSLSLLNLHVSANQIEAFMFTVDELTPRMVDVLGKVAAGLQLSAEQICFQNHLESFYYYVLNQNPELWKQDVMIFEYNRFMKTMCLECNRRTTPQVIFIQQKDYPDMQRLVWSSEEAAREQQKQELDSRFLAVVEGALTGHTTSTAYLLGEGFKEGWAKESLRRLCMNRRVFQGNNLYSKGACFAMLERINPSEKSRDYVYLGEEKLKSNIGMRVFRRGEDSYFAILDAGINWYEARTEFEVILGRGNQISFRITPLTGAHAIEKPVVLEGLPARPENTTRLKIQVEMSAVNQATVTVEDLGFGELFPTSGKGWTYTIEV
ncbi:MAG: hypothetical protein IJ409_10855 [Lachnospiraceae bacterium]|nr:hypothetical protein [Lachnospiraceae bacterium]